jgi:hypothetical protein
MHRHPPRHRAAPHLDAVAERLAARLSKIVVGDPALERCAWGRWLPVRSSAMSRSAWRC